MGMEIRCLFIFIFFIIFIALNGFALFYIRKISISQENQNLEINKKLDEINTNISKPKNDDSSGGGILGLDPTKLIDAATKNSPINKGLDVAGKVAGAATQTGNKENETVKE